MEKRKKVNKDIYENIIIAVAVMLYFIIINFSYFRLDEKYILIGLKSMSMVILLLSIVIFEIAYRKDSGKLAIYGIESLVIAAHTLSIIHVVQIAKLQFTIYILSSSYTFVIYYILKSMIINTIEKRRYLKSLSDIKEIVSIEPIKKEATKKKEK
ncbi:MAG: hypothetical protein HFJ17_06155 [Clostridia bacterium]|nr:hypothetical protein [Clostridia bacterium]